MLEKYSKIDYFFWRPFRERANKKNMMQLKMGQDVDGMRVNIVGYDQM